MKENLAFCEERIPEEDVIRTTAQVIFDKLISFMECVNALEMEEEAFPIIIEEFEMVNITLVEEHPDRIAKWPHFMEICLSPEALCWLDLSMLAVEKMLVDEYDKYKVIKMKGKKESSPQSWMIRLKDRVAKIETLETRGNPEIGTQETKNPAR